MSQQRVNGQSRQQVVAALQGQVRQLEGARRPPSDNRISSGYKDLDHSIPGGGFTRGTLVEWLADDGAGATTLALATARQACRAEHDVSSGALVVVDRSGEFYPPAAALAGVAWEHTVVLRTHTAADEIWAIEQALRCSAVGAVLAWPRELDDRAFRRLQLAAEAGAGLGLLVRPAAARHEPSWAEIRLLVRPHAASRSNDASPGARTLQIELLRCRGETGGGPIGLELDDETRVVPLAPPLVAPATAARSAEAS